LSSKRTAKEHTKRNKTNIAKENIRFILQLNNAKHLYDTGYRIQYAGYKSRQKNGNGKEAGMGYRPGQG